VGYHNKYLLGNLEANIITGRALATTKNVRGLAAGGGARVRAREAAAPHWIRPWATVHGKLMSSILNMKMLITKSVNRQAPCLITIPLRGSRWPIGITLASDTSDPDSTQIWRQDKDICDVHTLLNLTINYMSIFT